MRQFVLWCCWLTLSLSSLVRGGPGFIAKPNASLPGLERNARALLVFDPDAGGPATAVLLAGGFVGFAGDVAVGGIAAWDGARWSAFGQNLGGAFQPGVVNQFITYRGEAHAIGTFSVANRDGAVTANAVRWTGDAWSPAPYDNLAETELRPWTLSAVAPVGDDLIAAGVFVGPGGIHFNGVARWDGAAYHTISLPSEQVGDAIASIVADGDGVIVAGRFESIGGVPARNIARWNGSAWSALGGGLGSPHSGSVAGLLRFNGDIIAYGSFATSGTSALQAVARWDGVSWAPVLPPSTATRRALCAIANGDRLYVGATTFSATGEAIESTIEEWSEGGSRVIAASPVSLAFSSFAWFHDRLVAAGSFRRIGGDDACGIAEWDGAQWTTLGPPGTNGEVWSAVSTGHEVIAAGNFTSIEGTPADGMAAWNGSAWRALPGATLRGRPNAWVSSMLTAGGRAIVAGRFDAMGSTSAANVAAWNGDAWSSVGASLPEADSAGGVSSLATFRGDLLAGGKALTTAGGVPAAIARWNGSEWLPLPSQPFSANGWQVISAMTEFEGDLVAAGTFDRIDGIAARNIARWDGVRWRPMAGGLGDGFAQVFALIVFQDALYAAWSGPTSESFRGLARWENDHWASVGGGFPNGYARSLAVYGGDLIVGGQFASVGGIPSPGIARWTGAEWLALGSGLAATQAPTAYALLPFRGELLVGGNFAFAGGRPSAYFARWSDTGIPWIARQPQSARAGCDHPAPITLTVAPATGYGPLTYTWRRNGTPVVDAPPRIVGQGTATLTIAPASFADSGSYDVVIANAAGQSASTPASVIATIPGDANADGAVNAEDLMAVLGNYGSAPAPWTGGDVTGDGLCDFFDLSAVLGRYGEQCPR